MHEEVRAGEDVSHLRRLLRFRAVVLPLLCGAIAAALGARVNDRIFWMAIIAFLMGRVDAIYVDPPDEDAPEAPNES